MIAPQRASPIRAFDIAARPPENAYFQKNRDTIEKRSGRWLKDLARQSQTPEFNLERWIQGWDASVSGYAPHSAS
jgi:hypothetical protein